MQAAWFAFLHAGRRAHPRLRVLFAMLAGGAPLQLERYAARRGVPAPGPDPLVFYDISSYGPRMIGAVAEAVGAAQLVYGSDRPVVDPRATASTADLRDRSSPPIPTDSSIPTRKEPSRDPTTRTSCGRTAVTSPMPSWWPVATEFAARQELWSEHVSHDPSHRTYAAAAARRAPRRVAALLVA